MIKVNNLGYKYRNGKEVLKNINIQIDDGEVVCIIGKNGSGKSTLARLLAGITKPTDGDILIDGIDTKDKNKFLEIRKYVRNSFSKPRKSNNI